MFDRAALAALMAVLDTGSFADAAEALGLTQSAISQRIKSLEEDAGTTLIRRSRPAEPTEAGQRLRAHAETVALMERQVQGSFGRQPDRTMAPVRIAGTADTLTSWLLPALPQEPELFYDVIIDDQDHSDQLLTTGAAAAAITSRARPIPGCDVHALGALSYVAFCAPAYYARHFARGVTADALRAAPALTYSRKDRLQLAWAKTATGEPFARLPTHFVPSTDGITAAALTGLGWAVNPANLIEPHFHSGALVPLRRDITIETELYWQVPRQNREVLSALTSRLLQAAKRRRAV